MVGLEGFWLPGCSIVATEPAIDKLLQATAGGVVFFREGFNQA
jgi:hypothetical protein